MSIYIVYKTTNNLNNKIYIGVHKQKDLTFDGYLGSNKHLKNSIKFYGKENFSREILFSFEEKEEAYKKEYELVNEDFLIRDDTYNEKRGGFGGSNKGRDFHQSKDYKEKLSTRLKEYNDHIRNNNLKHPIEGLKRTEEFKEGARQRAETRISKFGFSIYKEHPMLGKKHSEESKLLIGQKNKGKQSRLGQVNSEEHIKNIKKTLSLLPILICPFCNLSGKGGNMKRYHFNNCKHKEDQDV